MKNWQSPSQDPWSNCLINSPEDDKGQSYYYSGRQRDNSKTICGRAGYFQRLYRINRLHPTLHSGGRQVSKDNPNFTLRKPGNNFCKMFPRIRRSRRFFLLNDKSLTHLTPQFILIFQLHHPLILENGIATTLSNTIIPTHIHFILSTSRATHEHRLITTLLLNSTKVHFIWLRIILSRRNSLTRFSRSLFLGNLSTKLITFLTFNPKT